MTRREDLSGKSLRTRVWSSTQKRGPQPWAPPSLGPELKNRSVASPKVALKSGRNSCCCFVSGLAGEEAHSAFELGENTETF